MEQKCIWNILKVNGKKMYSVSVVIFITVKHPRSVVRVDRQQHADRVDREQSEADNHINYLFVKATTSGPDQF